MCAAIVDRSPDAFSASSSRFSEELSHQFKILVKTNEVIMYILGYDWSQLKNLKIYKGANRNIPPYGLPQRRQAFRPSLSSESKQVLQMGKLQSWQATKSSPLPFKPTCSPQVWPTGTPDSIISKKKKSPRNPMVQPSTSSPPFVFGSYIWKRKTQ